MRNKTLEFMQSSFFASKFDDKNILQHSFGNQVSKLRNICYKQEIVSASTNKINVQIHLLTTLHGDKGT